MRSSVAVQIAAVAVLIGTCSSASAGEFRYLNGPATIGYERVIVVPSAPDYNSYSSLVPCTVGQPNCVAVLHSQERMTCALAAVSGRGYSSQQMIFALRAALAAGCSGAGIAVAQPPVVARY